MLSNIKIMLGISASDTSKDSVINCLIDLSKAEFTAITHQPRPDEFCIDQMVVHRYNLLGTEGLSSESYTGQSFSYQVDYPENLKRHILTFRKIRTF